MGETDVHLGSGSALTRSRHDERLFAVMGSASSAVIEHTVTAPGRAKHDQGLLLIGIFKLTKAVFFVAIAAGALHFIHHDLGESLDRVVKFLRFDAENRFVSLLLGKADLITHHRLRQISMGTAAYAVLCTIEGVGLMRRKVWAEYLTLWLSASFLPWEAYELLHHANLWRLGILLMNLMITLYLVWLLRRKRQRSCDPA